MKDYETNGERMDSWRETGVRTSSGKSIKMHSDIRRHEMLDRQLSNTSYKYPEKVKQEMESKLSSYDEGIKNQFKDYTHPDLHEAISHFESEANRLRSKTLDGSKSWHDLGEYGQQASEHAFMANHLKKIQLDKKLKDLDIPFSRPALTLVKR